MPRLDVKADRDTARGALIGVRFYLKKKMIKQIKLKGREFFSEKAREKKFAIFELIQK